MSPILSLSRRLFLFSAPAAFLAACAQTYATAFPAPLSEKTTRGWHVTAVRVDVPQTLTVSEAHSLVPEADIVWREDDPAGDRHQQVALILQNAVGAAVRGLKGRRAVELRLRVTRFHALSFEAETTLADAGVHNIQFDIAVVDARSGEVLAGPTHILADLPAWSGAKMREMRARGETQKSQISAHVTATIQAWLGIGPDNRASFVRLGD
ncbi:hypothetical protein GC209_08405 [bacterium]|nr:hypothetical protein [bacterium]